MTVSYLSDMFHCILAIVIIATERQPIDDYSFDE